MPVDRAVCILIADDQPDVREALHLLPKCEWISSVAAVLPPPGGQDRRSEPGQPHEDQ